MSSILHLPLFAPDLFLLQRPTNFGFPILRIGIVSWVVQVRFPWCAALPESVRSDPFLECGVSVLQLIIRSGMYGYRGQTARQCFGQDFAFAFRRGPLIMMGRNSHTGLQGHKPDACFNVSCDRVSGDRESPLLRMQEYPRQLRCNRCRDVGAPHPAPDHEDRLRGSFLL